MVKSKLEALYELEKEYELMHGGSGCNPALFYKQGDGGADAIAHDMGTLMEELESAYKEIDKYQKFIKYIESVTELPWGIWDELYKLKNKLREYKLK